MKEIFSLNLKKVRSAIRRRILSYSVDLSKSPGEIFKQIYLKNVWDSKESISGTGSELLRTVKVRKDLDTILNDFDIKTMIDIPCGDFNWVKELNLAERDIKYFGFDIVPDLIAKNSLLYSKHNITFEVKDILNDRLHKADLILCRDCLVHFSFRDIMRAIQNIINSDSTFLLVTSFYKILKNLNIKTGEWRPLNLSIPPFNLPEPLKIFDEMYAEDGFANNKSLYLYNISDLKEHFNSSKKRIQLEA